MSKPNKVYVCTVLRTQEWHFEISAESRTQAKEIAISWASDEPARKDSGYHTLVEVKRDE